MTTASPRSNKKQQDTGSDRTTEQESAAYRAGADLRSLFEEYLSGDRQVLYSPPEWAQKAIAHESKELQRYLKRRERLERKKVYQSVFSFNTLQLFLALVAMGGCNIYVSLATQFGLPLGQYADRGLVGTTDAIYTKEIKEGDVINGYEVTSGFGSRSAPKDGASTEHNGVDLATPEGINLYMIGEGGTVKCDEQPDGAGTYATITPKGLPFTFRAMHLSKCQSGEFGKAQGFAQTGNTGNSTGPHLHWEQLKDETPIAPTEGYLLWALTGNAPKPHGGEKAKTGFSGVDDFASAIAQQESGGDIGVVNSIGAMGKYQFMPDTLASVAPSCLGRDVSQDEFLANENMQDQIAKCYWQDELQKVQQETSDPVQQCRMMASYHYSGDSSLWDSTAPQNDAPSISDYTKQVCDRVDGAS